MTEPINGPRSKEPVRTNEPVHGDKGEDKGEAVAAKKPSGPAAPARNDVSRAKAKRPGGGKARAEARGQRPSLSGAEPPPRPGPASPSPADELGRTARCRRIEAQLKEPRVEWSGLDGVSRDRVATGDLVSGLAIIESLPLGRLAEELERLALGGTATLVGGDGSERWIALREADGVRVARAGTPEGAALEITHRARGDLDFLGAKVEAREGVLLVVEPPPEASLAKRLGLARGDRVVDALAPAADGAGAPVRVLRPGEAVPQPLPETSTELVEAEFAKLRARVHGAVVPVGHWLTELGVTPGALLAGASRGEERVWDPGKPLAALDAVREETASSGGVLTVELVTAEGYERHTLARSADGRLERDGAGEVDVTLSAFAPKGSSVRALLAAQAPYGFAVARASGSAEPEAPRASARPTEAPPLRAVPGVDDRDVAEYTAMTSYALEQARMEAALHLTPEQLAQMDELARKNLEALRAFAKRLERVQATSDDRALAGRLARLEVEDALARARADDAVDEPQAATVGARPVGRGRLALADALVAAVSRVGGDASLPIEIRNYRINHLANAVSSGPWHRPEEELPALQHEVLEDLRAIVERPPTPEELLAVARSSVQEPTASAGASGQGGALRARPESDPQLLASRVATVEGIRDALRQAIGAGEHDVAFGLERAFAQGAAGMRLDTVQRRFADLKRTTDEVLAACTKLEPELGGAAGAYARAVSLMLNEVVLGAVRSGNAPPARVFAALAAHRALVDDDLARASRAAAGLQADGEASGASEGVRFGSRAELEAHLVEWGERHPGEALRLHAPDGVTAIDVAKDSLGGWSVRATGTEEPPR